MPADNTYDATHPLARKTDYRASCHNRTTFAPGFWAKDGHYMQTDEQNGITYAVQKMVWVPHTMSTYCRQVIDLAECKGCDAPKDWNYRGKWR